MNTQENRIWIEPASPPEIHTPTASLAAVSDTPVEIAEPPEPSPAVATANILEDTGGNHLTPLDDW
jgi:hypothetical protein